MIAPSKDSRLPVGIRPRSADDEWLAYTDYVAKLLDCRPHRHYLGPAGEADAPPADGAASSEYYTLSLGERTRFHGGAHALAHGGPSLILLNSPRPAWWQRMSAPRALDKLFGSVLFVRRPRWPLRRILLVVRGAETDDAALSWIEKLTAPAWTKVTLLSVSTFHLWPREGLLPPALDLLLDPQESGQTALHTSMARLRELGIQGTVCWRPGAPLEQVRREVRAGDHDLIVVGAEPFSRWRRWQTGGLTGSLLGWADRPVLVAR